MTLTIKLVAIIALAAFTSAVPLTVFRNLGPSFETPDSYQLYQTQLPVELELPKEEANPVPFYAPEPATDLKAPRESQEPDYYQVPIPNQELVAPVDTEWNPNNDPIYFYEVPAVISKQEVPTEEFPKKYNEDIHDKKKPYSSKPKVEIIFEPINEKQYEDKQINLAKKYNQLAKKENQKIIQVLPSRKIKIPRKTINNVSKSLDSTLKSSATISKPTELIPKPTLTVPSSTYYIDPSSTLREPRPTASFPKYSDSVTTSNDQIESASITHDHGLSSQLTASLGIPSSAPTHEGASQGERLEFHMAGHDGPHSYKWGYDTGKGQNRLFRYEERDKEGVVKGHYGFHDKEGKLQVIHYDAHPHTGFHVGENS